MNKTGNENESTCIECDPGTYCEGTGNIEPTGEILLGQLDIVDKVDNQQIPSCLKVNVW